MSSGSLDIGAIIQGGTGIGEIVAGMLIQDETAGKIDDWRKKYPTYEIPAGIQEQLNILRQRSQTGLPGESLISNQIQQGTAQGVAASRESATSAADLMGATTQLYGQQTQALTGLQVDSARQKAANQLNYAQGLGTLGQYQDKAFTWNEAVPWQTKMNELMGIQQSAYDMLVGGINTLSQSGANMSGSGQSPTTESSNFSGTGQNSTSSTQNLQYSPQGINWQDQSVMQGETTQQANINYQNNWSW